MKSTPLRPGGQMTEDEVRMHADIVANIKPQALDAAKKQGMSPTPPLERSNVKIKRKYVLDEPSKREIIFADCQTRPGECGFEAACHLLRCLSSFQMVHNVSTIAATPETSKTFDLLRDFLLMRDPNDAPTVWRELMDNVRQVYPDLFPKDQYPEAQQVWGVVARQVPATRFLKVDILSCSCHGALTARWGTYDGATIDYTAGLDLPNWLVPVVAENNDSNRLGAVARHWSVPAPDYTRMCPYCDKLAWRQQVPLGPLPLHFAIFPSAPIDGALSSSVHDLLNTNHGFLYLDDQGKEARVHFERPTGFFLHKELHFVGYSWALTDPQDWSEQTNARPKDSMDSENLATARAGGGCKIAAVDNHIGNSSDRVAMVMFRRAL